MVHPLLQQKVTRLINNSNDVSPGGDADNCWEHATRSLSLWLSPFVFPLVLQDADGVLARGCGQWARMDSLERIIISPCFVSLVTKSW
ncbi:hypothetical protein CEXT_346581 [Caerostris extrusa]|uniref:Uncharacterized protein n=1 Tax=Caerostris extrusa TaxID=172846 RepID=A0AAV4P1F9_CAEEX|nr:hypothetical protein CEXT_346581 [Caerostris extrusa]